MVAPANDDFANAIPVTGLSTSNPVTVYGSNVEATTEDVDECYYGIGQTVWWKWTATFDDGHIVVDSSASSFTNVLAVFTGTSALCADLTEIGWDNGGHVEWDATNGVTYYIQIDTWPSGEGDVQIDFSITVPSSPPTPPPIVGVSECPTYVHYVGHGALSGTTWPNSGGSGQYTDGYAEWFQPGGVAGDLFVIMIYSNKVDLAVPSGYTSVLNQVWDNVPPSPFNGEVINGMPTHTQMQVIVGYRVLTSNESSGSGGTYSGLFYDMDALGGFGAGETVGVSVLRFECYEMGGEFPKVPFPTSPVKVGGFVSADYQLLEDPDWSTIPDKNTITVGSVTPDYVGNHVWLTLAGWHGPAIQRDSEDFVPDTPRTVILPGSGDFGLGLISGGSLRYDDARASVWVAATGVGGDYFVGAPQFEETYPGAGAMQVYPGDSWNDGFIGTLHVDFEDWSVLAGIFGVSILIQAPESARPDNDNIADAYTVPQCPIYIVECVFGQTVEGGEPLPEGNTAGTTVWFKWTPETDETGVVIDTEQEIGPLPGETYTAYTEYDTVLAVYTGSPGSLSLLASDDDGGVGSTSTVTIDVTGGTTYWIQVAGWGGDEGRMILTLTCNDQVLSNYWGILMEPM